MGLFDIFKKKAAPSSESLTINITPKEIEINGTAVTLPCPVEELTKLLGKPREVVYQTQKSDIPTRRLAKYPELAAKRVNYTWDKLGIYCYTLTDPVISCIGVQHRVRVQVAHTPSDMFTGKLTINGVEWSSVMRSGADMRVYRQITIGGCSINSGYADFPAVEKLGTADDYTGIEIQPAKE